jgi:hypothetical protein
MMSLLYCTEFTLHQKNTKRTVSSGYFQTPMGEFFSTETYCTLCYAIGRCLHLKVQPPAEHLLTNSESGSKTGTDIRISQNLETLYTVVFISKLSALLVRSQTRKTELIHIAHFSIQLNFKLSLLLLLLLRLLLLLLA